jgi:glutaredoxin
MTYAAGHNEDCGCVYCQQITALYAKDGIALLERYLAKHAAFTDYIEREAS